jgi:hypothetical protein
VPDGFFQIGLSGSFDEISETFEVELTALDAQLVSIRPGDQSAVCSTERLSKLGDVDLNALRRARWSLLAPELIDQAVTRNHLIRVQEQDREESALLPGSERKRFSFLNHLEGAKDPKLHAGLLSSKGPLNTGLPQSGLSLNRPGARWAHDEHTGCSQFERRST